MRKSIEFIIIIFTALLLGIGLIWFFKYLQTQEVYTQNFDKEQLRKFFYEEKISREELSSKYKNNEKIKILIVPGHTDKYPGTEFRNIREVDLNVEVAKKLYELFQHDDDFETYITQREVGVFDKNISEYFENKETSEDFKIGYQRLSRWFEGESSVTDDFLYTETPEEIVNMLYAINAWSNDEEIDIIIHIHFNNYHRQDKSTVGEYSGFSIYAPEDDLSNSTSSKQLADSIKRQLLKSLTISNSPSETDTIIENDSLIALGAFNSLEAVSVLIEYGFIYESQFQSEETLKNITEKTYFGVIDFLK